MKIPIPFGLIALALSIIATRAAPYPTLTNFNARHFVVVPNATAPTNVIRVNLDPAQFDTNSATLTITNVTGVTGAGGSGGGVPFSLVNTNGAAVGDYAMFADATGTNVVAANLLRSIVTDTSITPTTVHFRSTPPLNCVRIWTGELPAGIAEIDVYVVSGGSNIPVRIPAWQSRMLYVSGPTVSLGTTNGATVTACLAVPQLTTVTVTGLTNRIPVDRAGPPLWTPSLYHVSLPTNNAAFSISANGSQRTFFVAESDGFTWSPPKWIVTPTASDITIRCTHRLIAIASYTESSVSIICPQGTAFSNVSKADSLGIPTAPTIVVSDAAGLMTALGTAVSGDVIGMIPGTYILPSFPTQANFVANIASGLIGAEGITLLGLGAGYSEVVVIGGMSLTQTGAKAPVSFKNFTVDLTGLTNADWTLWSGSFRAEDVRWTGIQTSSGQNIYLRPSSDTIFFDFLRCYFDTAKEDLVSCTGASDVYAANSKIRFINCIGHDSGGDTDDQILTSHGGLDIFVYGGRYYNTDYNIFANGTATETVYANFVDLPGTAGTTNHVSNTALFGCKYVLGGKTDGIGGQKYLAFSRVINTNLTSDLFLFDNIQIPITGNYAKANRGNAFHYWTGGGVTATFNVLDTFAKGISLEYAASLKPTDYFFNNTFVGCTLGLVGLTANSPSHFTNNVFKTSGDSIYVNAAGMSVLSSDYNVLDPTVDADYTAGANDIVGADAAISAAYFPTASGNCDNNGAPIFAWVGGSDWQGFPLRYSVSETSRGARANVLTGRPLIPDIW